MMFIFFNNVKYEEVVDVFWVVIWGVVFGVLKWGVVMVVLGGLGYVFLLVYRGLII